MEVGKILSNGKVEKEYFREGYIYKNKNNFDNKVGICYIAEYQCEDNIINKKSIEGKDYETYNSMLEKVEKAYKDYNIDETKYSKEDLLESVFEGLDWQHFDTLLFDYIDSLDEEKRCKYE